MASQAKKLDQVFGALSNPTRRALLDAVANGEQTVLQLAKPHKMSLNAVSKHLKRLEDAGLVRREVDGSFHRISLDADAMKSAFKWMSHYAPFWADNLASLKRYVEEET